MGEDLAEVSDIRCLFCYDPFSFVVVLFFLHQADRPEQAIGFKLFPEHIYLDPEAMAPPLADPAVKKIVLRRGNAVAAYVSQRRALLTGQFLQVKHPGDVSLHIDPDELQRHLTNYEGCYTAYSRLLAGQVFHEVLYEDLCGGARDKTFKGIADFLGIDERVPAPLTQTIRQTPASISNHEELKTAYLHTAYRGDFGECCMMCVPPTPNPHAMLRRRKESQLIGCLTPPPQVHDMTAKKARHVAQRKSGLFGASSETNTSLKNRRRFGSNHRLHENM